jgi:hypothetical protein
MAKRRNTGNPIGFAARLGQRLMMLVVGKELRFRQVIARTATHARSSRDLELKARWHARHNPVAGPRVE